jgi:hypothetical protein
MTQVKGPDRGHFDLSPTLKRFYLYQSKNDKDNNNNNNNYNNHKIIIILIIIITTTIIIVIMIIKHVSSPGTRCVGSTSMADGCFPWGRAWETDVFPALASQ